MRRRVAAGVAATVMSAATLVGCGVANVPQAAPPATAPSSAPAGTTAAQPAAMARSVPTKVSIPSIGAESSLVSLGLNPDGTVQVPPVSHPQQAGWYDKGPTPGQAGPAVVLGHVDGDHMKGVFYDLKDVRPGDEVDISRADGTTARFRVRTVDSVSKGSFPTQAVYGNTAGPQLRVITCGGSFDAAAHSYRDNIIVFADLM